MEEKIKPILPSLREKKRYIVFKVNSKEKLAFKQVNDRIMQESLRFLGELGVSKAGMIILKERYEDNIGIIRVNNKYVKEVKMALSLVKDIKIDVLGVSGIINKTRRFIEKTEEK